MLLSFYVSYLNSVFSSISSFPFHLSCPSVVRQGREYKNKPPGTRFLFLLNTICNEVVCSPWFSRKPMGSKWQGHLLVIVPKKWFLATGLLSAHRFLFFLSAQEDSSGCFSGKSELRDRWMVSVERSCFPNGPKAVYGTPRGHPTRSRVHDLVSGSVPLLCL